MSSKYWRSPEELEAIQAGLPFDAGAEFDSSPTREGEEDGITDESRRTFLKLMGASMALMTSSACTRRPVEKIVPYLKQPEEITPGIANWYASTCMECESACGILVKTREGRPIKFEGNPAHPVNQGGLCARGQASILNVYDADRLQTPQELARKGTGKAITWDSLDQTIGAKLRNARGAGKKVRVLTGENIGPSTEALLREFTRGTAGAHITFDPLGSEETAIGSEVSYGNRVLPRYRFERAELVVTFGADFLGTWHSSVENARGFAKRRKPGEKMAKLISFESLLTLTGSNADERYTVKASHELKAALALAHELIITQGRSRFSTDSEVGALLRGYPAATVAGQIGVAPEAFRKAASELWENRGKSIVLGGGHLTKGDAGVALEIVVNLLNSALENEGATIDRTLSAHDCRSSFVALGKLIDEMKTGQVAVLIISGLNPIYTLPKALGFEEALAKVETVVYVTMQLDETARVSDYAAALSHHTEAWGDASPQTGVYSVVQPTIAPLYTTRSFEEMLMAWARNAGVSGSISTMPSWVEYLKSQWRDTVYREYKVAAPFALFWESLLREGVFDGLAARGLRQSGSGQAKPFATRALKLVSSQEAAGDTLVLYPKVSLHDGRNANNAWLQEMPDPITKATWDNYALISINRAKSLGIKQGDVVRLKVGNASVEVPALLQPGLHDQTIGLALGYGRHGVGRVANDVGVNAFTLAVAGTQVLKTSNLSTTIEKTGKNIPIATTQRHHSMEGRDIIKEATLEAYRRNPHAGNEHHEELTTLWSGHEYKGHKWAMSIDLSSCTGCSACVIACQAENNIPVVGKEFVRTSREMHWLRIDRYYSGRSDAPETLHQPMLCQQCDNAPCETVCPVLATLHSDEGLNQQVYNRCVGTRYCANNCPYKVRRFNWFTFTDVAKPLNLVFNPDVTVRTRGVMEKCTFCMQRIREVKDRAKDMGSVVKDGDIKTACQQTCPSQAISFGDINDKTSKVAQFAKDPRGYRVLEEINTRSSITYLTKIRNKKA